MKSTFHVGQWRRFCLFPAASLFILTTACLPAAERTNGWSDGGRVIAAMNFFERMSAEFAERLQRLGAGAADPVLPLPLVRSILSSDSGGDRDIERYKEGKLGESQTEKVTGRALAELEKARALLAAAEAKAAKAWAAKNKTALKNLPMPPEAQALIYEMKITARRLGVLLDNSRGMTHLLPALRKSIVEKFPDAYFTQVEGCRLKLDRPQWGPYPEWYFATPIEERNPFEARWFLPEIPKNDIHYHTVEWNRNAMPAFRSLVTLMEVDAIYWFTDFDDEIDSRTALALEKLLTDKKVKLYVHTLNSTPPGIISSIIRRTGGSMTKAVPEQKAPHFNEAATLPAEPIIPGYGASRLYQMVKVSGTVAGVRYVEDERKAFLVLQENDLMIEMKCQNAMPDGQSMADYLKNRCKAGTRIEAFGMVTNLTRARHRLIVDSSSFYNFWIPEPAVTPAPAVPPPPPSPASPAPPSSGVTTVTDLSPQSLERHLNQLRQFDSVVKSVEILPQHGHVKIFLNGTPLYLFCRKENVETVFPGIDPLSFFTAGRKLTVQGPITLFNGIAQVILTRPDQWTPASEKTVAAGPAAEPKLIGFTREELLQNVGQNVRFTTAVGSVLRTKSAGDIRIWFPGTSLGVICPGEKVEEVFGRSDPLEILKRLTKITIKGRLLKAEGDALKIILDTRGQIGPG